MVAVRNSVASGVAGGELPQVVRALLRPERYPHAAGDLQLHETHISWVVLAGPYAYKLKKPVDFGFLDFSTLERRAAACADEVRLNRRLCPEVYLGVVVAQAQGASAIQGLWPPRGTWPANGHPRRAQSRFVTEPVEPAVWMRRLPAAGMLDHLLASGAADAPLLRGLAAHLARFHATAATGAGVDEYGSRQAIQANWEEHFSQTAAFAADLLPKLVRVEVVQYVEGFLRTQAGLLAERVSAGRVRDGHGDLHAASICVERTGSQVRYHLFDCIEFTPRFRCADVAAEVAFLAMDLDYHGRPDLDRAFVGAYVEASGDAGVLRLLDFYRCYRAFVRGKVLGFRLEQPGLSAAEAVRVAAQVRAYFDLAWAYADGRAPAPLGVAGCGHGGPQ
jgi:hypothetical protein